MAVARSGPLSIATASPGGGDPSYMLGSTISATGPQTLPTKPVGFLGRVASAWNSVKRFGENHPVAATALGACTFFAAIGCYASTPFTGPAGILAGTVLMTTSMACAEGVVRGYANKKEKEVKAKHIKAVADLVAVEIEVSKLRGAEPSIVAAVEAKFDGLAVYSTDMGGVQLGGQDAKEILGKIFLTGATGSPSTINEVCLLEFNVDGRRYTVSQDAYHAKLAEVARDVGSKSSLVAAHDFETAGSATAQEAVASVSNQQTFGGKVLKAVGLGSVPGTAALALTVGLSSEAGKAAGAATTATLVGAAGAAAGFGVVAAAFVVSTILNACRFPGIKERESKVAAMEQSVQGAPGFSTLLAAAKTAPAYDQMQQKVTGFGQERARASSFGKSATEVRSIAGQILSSRAAADPAATVYR